MKYYIFLLLFLVVALGGGCAASVPEVTAPKRDVSPVSNPEADAFPVDNDQEERWFKIFSK